MSGSEIQINLRYNPTQEGDLSWSGWIDIDDELLEEYNSLYGVPNSVSWTGGYDVQLRKNPDWVPIPEANGEEIVTLELSKEEARSLLRVTQQVGGSPLRSRRRHLDTIAKVLFEAGVEDPGKHVTERGKDIFFVEESLFSPSRYFDTGNGEITELLDDAPDYPAIGEWIRVFLVCEDTEERVELSE